MANFVMSRARRLFSYTDLGGNNSSSTMDLEQNSTSEVQVGLFKTSRKKCILLFTAVFGLSVVIIIGKKLISWCTCKQSLF